MGETPKRPYGRRVISRSGSRLSALADFFPGVAPLERAAVVRIEAAARRSVLFAGDCRGGLLRVRSRRRRKARRLVELFPDVNIRVLYQRDYLHLLVKYGLEPPSQLVEAGVDGVTPMPFELGPRPAADSRARGSAAESA